MKLGCLVFLGGVGVVACMSFKASPGQALGTAKSAIFMESGPLDRKTHVVNNSLPT
jgi:hypothetical protein